jgi:hypothetical protein
MYVCMYVCRCVCMYVCMCLWYVCMYSCICMYVHVYVSYAYECMYNVCVCINVLLRKHVRMFYVCMHGITYVFALRAVSLIIMNASKKKKMAERRFMRLAIDCVFHSASFGAHNMAAWLFRLLVQ